MSLIYHVVFSMIHYASTSRIRTFLVSLSTIQLFLLKKTDLLRKR